MDILIESYDRLLKNMNYHFNYDTLNDNILDDIEKVSNKYITNTHIHYFKGNLLDKECLKFINENNIQLWLHLNKNTPPEIMHHYGMVDKLTVYYDITDDIDLLNVKEMRKLYTAYQSYYLDIRLIFGKDYNGNILEYLDITMEHYILDMLDELIHSIYSYFYRFYYDSINYTPYYFFKQVKNELLYYNKKINIDDFETGKEEISMEIPKKCIKCDLNDICPKLEYFTYDNCIEKYGPTLNLMKKKFFRSTVNENNSFLNVFSTKSLKRD